MYIHHNVYSSQCIFITMYIMSQSLEDAESVHADSANVVSPILNSSDEAGKKKR